MRAVWCYPNEWQTIDNLIKNTKMFEDILFGQIINDLSELITFYKKHWYDYWKSKNCYINLPTRN